MLTIKERDLSNFITEPGDERVTIFPSQSTPRPLPLLNEDELDEETVAEHYREARPPEVSVYGLENYTCWGSGLLVREGKLFLNPDVMPPYFDKDLSKLPDVWAGALRCEQPRLVTSHEALAVALHPNMVYGHFLLEILPRLYLLGLLKGLGKTIPLLMQQSLPDWVRSFVYLYYAADEIVSYDWSNEMVVAPKFVVPTMMHTLFAYHPAFNLMVADLLRRCGIDPFAQRPGVTRRIYLSRSQHVGGWHIMENEREVEIALSELGFEIIHPQKLSLQEQLAIYVTSSVIVGQFSSALHNTLFAPFGTTVIALNRVNWYQSAIARIRRQHLAYILPSDGFFRDYRVRSEQGVRFSINVQHLTEFLTTHV